MTEFSRTSSRSLFAAMAILTITVATSIATPQAAHAYDEQSTSALNVDSKGIALQGYDPVSYFTSTGPQQGAANLAETIDGTTYWFASSANRDVFKQDPGKYEPAFGGFCAMGVALEKKLDVNPLLWRVVDGKLYLNVHKEAQARWLEDVQGNIAKANENWPTIKDAAPKAL